jgi:DNA-binding MarR family transcriptional regulator
MPGMSRITFDGYIIETMMRDLVGHDKKPSAFIVLLYLWARTSGMRQRILTASLQEIATDTGLSKSAVQAGLKLLRRRRLIRLERDSQTSKPSYYLLRPWQRHARASNSQGVRKSN